MRSEAPPDSPVEIIDIIDDGIDPFGERSQNTTIEDDGGPRWVGPTAAMALVALIGYGIATSASTSSVPKVAEAPSTTLRRPATTLPTPVTAIETPPVVPYYSADPPREYHVQYAAIDDDVFNGFPGEYQLWAMPGASATEGSWFSIESLRTGPQHPSAVGAIRVPTADQTMLISRLPSGRSSILFTVDDVMSVTITALGWDDEDLVRLAQSVTMSEGSTEGNEVRPSDPTLIDDFQLLTTAHPLVAIRGEPLEQIFYSEGSDLGRGFSLGVSKLNGDIRRFTLNDRRIALRFFLDRTTPFEVDGHSAIAGAIAMQPDEVSVGTWIEDGHIVTVTGTLPVSQLIAIAQTVHQVSSEEWDGMRFQASRNQGFTGDFVQGEPKPVAFGTDAAGGQWTVNVSVSTAPGGAAQSVDWQWPRGNGFSSAPADIAKIETVVDGERTYVLAELPRDVAPPTAQLQVTRAGMEPAIASFTDIDPSLDRTFAAFAFSEATDYTAQIIGADGAVLATWPAT